MRRLPDSRPSPGHGAGGFVPLDNRVFDGLVLRWPLSPAAHRVIGWIIRDSWGWGRVWTRTPLDASLIARTTRLHRTTVWDAIRTLVDARFVKVRSDGRARVNKCVLAGRYPKVAKSQRCQTATSSNGYGTVAKRLRTRSQTAALPSSNDYAPSLEVQAPPAVAEPYRHLQTVTDITDSGKKIATQSPATRDGLTLPFERSLPESPTPANVANQQGQPRTISQRMWDEDCGDVLSHWWARFGADGVDYSWAGLIIRECRRLEVCPLWLIDQVPADHPNPQARIMGYLNNRYPVPEIPDRDRSNCSFTAWDSRPRRCQGPQGVCAIGDVLAQLAAPKSQFERSLS